MSDSDPAEIPAELPKPLHPRKVLLRCILFVFVAAAAYSIVTPLLPARLTDGPMIQNVTTDAASIIWYTSRNAIGQVAVTIAGQTRLLPSANEDTRHRLRLTGLSPATAYTYEIRVNGRTAHQGTLTTGKPRGARFSFIVFGDSGRGRVEQYNLAAEMSKLEADFILHTGDVVYGAGQRRDYPQRFFRPYADMLARTCFWPSLGNHDAGEPSFGGDYLGVFELPENGPPGLQPERNYWFDFADARIAIIDSNLTQDELAGQVAPWLTDVFADSQARWRFVVMHHPAYTSGKYEPDQRIISALSPIFEQSAVDIVFAGHDHNYQRTKPLRDGQQTAEGEGVVYVVTGAGGGGIYPLKPPDQRPGYFAAGDGENYSFTHVTIDGDTLILRQIALGGDELDRWQYTKPAD